MNARKFTVAAVFKAVDRMTAPVTRMQNRVARFGRGAGKSIQKLDKSMMRFASTLQRAALAVGVVGTLATGAVGNILKVGAGYEQAIANVGAVALMTRDQVKMLDDQAIHLGATTKFTAAEAAGAMEILMRAGFGVEGTFAAVPGVLSAAAASNLEIAETADIVSNALKGMGLEYDQANRVADVLALASARTNSTMGTLGEALALAGATTSRFGISIEDVVTSLALMQDVGLSASISGTALNTALTKMTKPSEQMARTMRALGISFQDAEGNMKPFPVILAELTKMSQSASGNMGAVALFAELVGLRGQKAADTLSRMHERGRWEWLNKQLYEAGGSAKKMADLRMDTLTGDMILLGSAVDSVKIKISEMNSGGLRDLVQGARDWVLANEELVATKVGEFLGDMIRGIPAFVEHMKSATRVVTGFLAAALALRTASAMIGSATALIALGLSGPVAWAIVLVGTLAAGLTALILKMGGFKKVWKDFVKWAEDHDPGKKVREMVNESKDRGSGRFSGGFGAPMGGGFLGVNAGQYQGDRPSETVTLGDRIERSVQESRTKSTTEVLIRDETGRAEIIPGGTFSPGSGVILQPSGGF